MITRLKETSLNLCEHCNNTFATCNSTVEFGNGVPSDNIIECNIFSNDGSLPDDWFDEI